MERMLDQFPSITMLSLASNLENFGGGGGGGGGGESPGAILFGSLLPPTPLHKGTNIRHLLSLPRGAAYFQHIDLVFQWLSKRGLTRHLG